MTTRLAQISAKFQIVIPQEVREDMGVKVGDRLVFVKGQDGKWMIERVPCDPVEALRMAGRTLMGTVEEVHQEFEEGWKDEYRDG
ncbi:MAG: AbrB/MazE/SpoVT family DNA-binding domain-containing protein [Anaerolineae bacterium]|nr:AbrB/MazE/SpoVT family DNA-binding domain-containing protein [Anaerolineae bacterium]MDH7473598.1 AbrB/MazE/SpoVT family DNA-binding domain-containing protein [Anaerolineae bacterium]